MFDELGLVSIHNSALDVKLLCIQRFVRLFAYGASTLVLALYLSALGNSDRKIGLFMTLTLFGDILISFFLTLFADGLGRKMVLAVGALLMTASGLAFGLSRSYWVLLAAAVLGVISPSGNEIGPFRAIEESMLAHLTEPAVRSDIFAWYSLIGTAGAACGMMTSGWVVHSLQGSQWSEIQSFRVIFFLYAVIGLFKFFLACMLSSKVEADKKKPQPVRDTETAPLLDNNIQESPKKQKKLGLFRLPDMSQESKIIIVNLCLLFAVDSFASGLASLSWVTYFFRRKFNLEEGKLGSLFFTTTLISSASMLVASSLAKRIGNVQTMVFTHLPSAMALALIPVPSSLPLAMVFLVLRACTQSMDVAPRSAFVAAVLLPHERTAVMGLINVVKTSSQSLGPLITGVLASSNHFWVAFVLAGALKATYDLGMLAVFAGHKTREEAQVGEEGPRS